LNEIFPDEGLDLIQTIFPKGGTNLTTTYLFLWTGATASTTPASTCVLATSTGISEAAYTSYARQAMAAATWGTLGAKTIWTQGGRGTAYPQVSFPAAGGSYATAINGFGITNQLATGAGSIGIALSNFDDVTGVATMAIGDVIKVTPTFGLLG
jgi:hypothetical protein